MQRNLNEQYMAFTTSTNGSPPDSTSLADRQNSKDQSGSNKKVKTSHRPSASINRPSPSLEPYEQRNRATSTSNRSPSKSPMRYNPPLHSQLIRPFSAEFV